MKSMSKLKDGNIKVFCHLVDICKVNTRTMYQPDFSQLALSSNKMLANEFANELGKALMHTNKPSTPNQRCMQSKWQSSSGTNALSSKRAVVPMPDNDIQYNNIGHWPEVL